LRAGAVHSGAPARWRGLLFRRGIRARRSPAYAPPGSRCHRTTLSGCLRLRQTAIVSLEGNQRPVKALQRFALACLRVRTLCTVSRRPAGPLAPPPQRARLRSRWRSRYGGANAGRRTRKARGFRAAVDLRLLSKPSRGGCPCSRCGIVQGRAEPVKAVCDRRTTAPVKLPSARTREDDLDRTCPAKEMAAIGSMDASGQADCHLSISRHIT
jgi:hypothetical protein